METRAGTVEQLKEQGHLTVKVGRHPVVVFWHEDQAWAIEDRCPHLGLPMHQGTVESGMVTCHWHHARFDLSSGCTLDPWADDAPAYDVEIRQSQVYVSPKPVGDQRERLYERLADGLEEQITLVTAKSVLGLLDAAEPPVNIVAAGARFGAANRSRGWGSGMTVLTATANIIDHLDPPDKALALTQALAFLAGDVAGHPPRFGLSPLNGSEAEGWRLAEWYRRFIDTRSADAAERALATSIEATDLAQVEAMMFSAATDHVYIDEGHTIDFTNKAFELINTIGVSETAALVLPTLVQQTAAAIRHEELAEWRHPYDLSALIQRTTLSTFDTDPTMVVPTEATFSDAEVSKLGWALLDDDPEVVVGTLTQAAQIGASAEQLARSVALAAALRIVRFHTQNDHRDWNSVHHGFTTANAVHQAITRQPSVELLRGVVHSALKVYLDRFLNVPAARMPGATSGSLDALSSAWDAQGQVEQAGNEVYGYLVAEGDPARLIATLGRALLTEDAGFHWFQLFEAAVTQHQAWPQDSQEGRLILVGFARFLAAHTPTRRELSRVVDIARRLGRGDELFVEPTT